MLINARSPEELRIALVSDRQLESYQVEVADTTLTRGNIYRGVIAGIQPALNAAFVDYGADRNGFLAIQDVVAGARTRQPASEDERPSIDEILERGRPIVVQVTRDPEGTKGAALTTNLSLAGRYLVLTPFDDHRGVSRKVEDEESRRELREMVGKLDLPEGCGVIVRTNAFGQTRTELNRDAAALLKLWKRIQVEGKGGRSWKLLYSDQDLILKALRDQLDNSVEEILVDDDMAFASAEAYVQAFMPRSKVVLTRYEDRAPLFTAFDLEAQIEAIYRRSVPLGSGGAIVIDGTEALTAIDVNSGKSTRAASQEETAYATNLEAAVEVARQLRLRDIGGLVVVDFIDMKSAKHRKLVEKAVKDAMKPDRARVTIGRISGNGLLEINRQRIQQELKVRSHRSCPTCDGTGRIASPEIVGLNLLRRIEARAVTGRLGRVRIELHPELADAFQNQRRHEIAKLEREFHLSVEVIASARLHRPDEVIQWEEREGGAIFEPAPKVAKPAVQVRDVLAAAAPDEEPAGESDGEVRQAGKRRRKRRGKDKERDKPKVGGEAPEAKPEREAGARGGGRPAKGRRREKVRPPAPVGAPAAAAVAGHEVEPSVDLQPDGASGPGNPSSEPKGKRRRRRRRRGGNGSGGEGSGGPGAGSEGGPTTGGPGEGGFEGGDESRGASEGGSESAPGESKARRRSRRRNRRRGPRGAGGPLAGDDGNGSPPVGPPAG